MQPITITYPVRPRRRSLACNAVADLFGLAPDEAPLIVAENVTLDIRQGDIVLFVGPSGSGKSSLLRVAGRELDAIDANALKLPDEAIVDGLPGELRDKLDLLSACGLAEARLLRRPDELSDGQRCRYRLALASSRCRKPGQFILADEFCAVLDRTLARTVAFNLRKLCTRMKVGALLATTHDDFIDDLQPDLLVQCHGDGAIDIERRQSKKNGSASRTSFGYRPVPSPTGRISLGGITEATRSDSCAASSSSGTANAPSGSACSPARPRASRCGRATSACAGRDRANISER